MTSELEETFKIILIHFLLDNRSSARNRGSLARTTPLELSIIAFTYVPSLIPDTSPQLTVSVCVDGFHKQGISSIQTFLQTGSGVLWSSRIQTYNDSLLSGSSSLSTPRNTMDGHCLPSPAIPPVQLRASSKPGPGVGRTSPEPL